MDAEKLLLAVRHVRTPDGARLFGQPIGSVIRPDVLPTVRRDRFDPYVGPVPKSGGTFGTWTDEELREEYDASLGDLRVAQRKRALGVEFGAEDEERERAWLRQLEIEHARRKRLLSPPKDFRDALKRRVASDDPWKELLQQVLDRTSEEDRPAAREEVAGLLTRLKGMSSDTKRRLDEKFNDLLLNVYDQNTRMSDIGNVLTWANALT